MEYIQGFRTKFCAKGGGSFLCEELGKNKALVRPDPS